MDSKMGLLVVLVMTMLWVQTMAQSSCTSAIIGLAPCLNFVTGNSSTPSSSCCSQLASVVQSRPLCLCSLLNGGGATLGITINQTLALALPNACNVQTPPISTCNAADRPASSPVSSPLGSPTDDSNVTPDSPIAPPTNDIPAGKGSKTVPTTGGDASNGKINNLPFHLIFFLLFIASCASTLTSF